MTESEKAGHGEAEPAPLKQAVIVIHGMGEQRPMETLRAFVGGLYADQTNSALAEMRRNAAKETNSRQTLTRRLATGTANASKRVAEALVGTGPQADSDQYWIVPDARAGSHELSRIRTRSKKVGGREVNTDFYEFYYADLLTGNTLTQLVGWVRGLLLRWPHQVPKPQAVLWVVLWLAAVMAVVLLGPELANNPMQRIVALFTGSKAEPGLWGGLASVAVGVLGAWYLVRRWRQHIDDRERTPAKTEVSLWFSFAVALLIPIGLAVAAYFLFPWGIFRIPAETQSNILWSSWVFKPFALIWGWPLGKLLIGVLIYKAIHGFGVPIFGDVARYVRSEPAYVAARQAIRERGLKLMESVHGAKKKDAAGNDTAEPEYGRVIVVAHSLGSIIALDLLRLYWAKQGLGQDEAVTEEEAAALAEVNALYNWSVASHVTSPAPDAVPGLPPQQRLASEVLKTGSRKWRVSDFITLGSPLTHAEFLVARDRPRFEAMKAERMIPTCPPLQEVNKDDSVSFLYPPSDGGPPRPHHAAPFASVRFTAIFDPARFYIFGDFIGGPLKENLGPGVVEFPVRIKTPALLFKRLVTHTHYWNAKAKACFAGRANDAAELPDGLADAANDKESAHLAALRSLIWLKGPKTAPGGTAPKAAPRRRQAARGRGIARPPAPT